MYLIKCAVMNISVTILDHWNTPLQNFVLMKHIDISWNDLMIVHCFKLISLKKKMRQTLPKGCQIEAGPLLGFMTLEQEGSLLSHYRLPLSPELLHLVAYLLAQAVPTEGYSVNPESQNQNCSALHLDHWIEEPWYMCSKSWFTVSTCTSILVFSSSVCILWSDYCNVLYKHQLIFATFFYYAAIQASMWTWMSSDQ